jgi:hypothetical protein
MLQFFYLGHSESLHGPFFKCPGQKWPEPKQYCLASSPASQSSNYIKGFVQELQKQEKLNVSESKRGKKEREVD